MNLTEQELRAEFRMLYDRLEGMLKNGSKPDILDLACEAAVFVVGGQDIGLDMSKEQFDLVELLARHRGHYRSQE